MHYVNIHLSQKYIKYCLCFVHVKIHRLSLCVTMLMEAGETCIATWLLVTCRAPVY